MPYRRGLNALGAGLTSLGDSLDERYKLQQLQDQRDQTRAATDARAGQTQDSETYRMLLGDLLKNPQALARYGQARNDATGQTAMQGNLNVPPQKPLPPELQALIPTQQDLNEPVSKSIENAKNLSELPTEEGVLNQFSGPKTDASLQVGPMKGGSSDGTLASQDVTGGGPSPALKAIVAERNAKQQALTQNQPRVDVTGTDPATGAPTRQFLTPSDQAKYGPNNPLVTGPTAQQAGGLDATKELAGPLSPGVTQAKARQAGATAGAEAAAKQPYEKPDIMYDTSGAAHAVKFGPKGASEVPGLPPGLSGKAPAAARPLNATEVDTVSNMNSAEKQGVTVLKLLHDTGADQSNNPLDPRWQKFTATVLKTEDPFPGKKDTQLSQAEIQQRTAYVNAVLTRALMGARPSQYIAQIIQQHLPSGEMSGAKLAQVMGDVLDEVGSKRDEMSALTGNTNLAPHNGLSWHDYKQQLANDPAVRGAAILGGR